MSTANYSRIIVVTEVQFCDSERSSSPGFVSHNANLGQVNYHGLSWRWDALIKPEQMSTVLSDST